MNRQARGAKYTKSSLTLYLDASAVRPERRSVKKARASGSLVRAKPPGRLIACTAAFRFARETLNGYSSLKSRSQRDTLVDRRTETECPKLIGPKISIDRTILICCQRINLLCAHIVRGETKRAGLKMNLQSHDKMRD